MSYVYENHKLENELLPFIFHTIRLEKNSSPNNTLGNWHENPELLFFTKGCGSVFLGQTICNVCAGDLVVVNADTFHDVRTENELEYFCLIADTGFFADNGIDINKISFEPYIKEKTELESSFRKIKALYGERDLFFEAKIRAEVLNIIINLCENHSSVNNSSIVYSDEIKQAVIYIKENFNKKITVDGIIRHVGMSRAYFSREFKKYTGLSIITYLNNVRCIQARAMICSGVGVSEAAQSCGFENQSYFTRTYKKIMGVLPSHEYYKNK